VANLSWEIADFARAAGATKVDRVFLGFGFVDLYVDNGSGARDERRQAEPKQVVHEFKVVHSVSQAIIPPIAYQVPELRPLKKSLRRHSGGSPKLFFALRQTICPRNRRDDIREPLSKEDCQLLKKKGLN
jgi:hypothetical protein